MQFNDVKLPAATSRPRCVHCADRLRVPAHVHPAVCGNHSSTGNLFSSNFRFRWEYLAGSELLRGVHRRRDTTARISGPEETAFVVKVNWLLPF